MKKVLVLILGIFVLPLMVSAAAVDGTLIAPDQFDPSTSTTAATDCAAVEANNTTDYSSAVSGYYVYCIQISCTNSVNVYNIANPLSSKVTCANGNKKPYLTPMFTGAASTSSGQSLGEGKACTAAAGSPYFYATEEDFFECAFTYGTDGTSRVAYTGSSSSNTNNSSNTSGGNTSGGTSSNTSSNTSGGSSSSTTKDSTTSPNTGVENYYIILASAIVVLSIGLYILNKKNFFKKI